MTPETKIRSAEEPKDSSLSDGWATAEPSITFEPHPGPKKIHWKDVQDHGLKYWMWYAGIFAILFIIWFVWFMFIATQQHEMTIERFSWERKIEVLDYQPRDDQGWSTPSDAYDVSRSWRVHHYERVLSHYETRTETYSCGTSDNPRTCTRTRQEPVYRDEPVYRWYYHYTVDRWRFARWITTSASNQSTPYWDDLKDEKFDSRDIIGNEQLSGKRTELYRVYLSDNEDGKRYTQDIDLATWTKLEQGSVVTANITRTDKIRSVNWSS